MLVDDDAKVLWMGRFEEGELRQGICIFETGQVQEGEFAEISNLKYGLCLVDE